MNKTHEKVIFAILAIIFLTYLITAYPSSNSLKTKEDFHLYGSIGYDVGMDVEIAIDGNIVLVKCFQNIQQHKLDDIQLVIINSSYNENNTIIFGGNNDDYCKDIERTDDGNYILAGYTGSYGAGFYDMWIIHCNINGLEIWNKTYGGIYIDMCYSLHKTNDGGFILGGSTESFGVQHDGPQIWIIKIDENGTEIWNRTYHRGSALSILDFNNNGYLIIGEIDSDSEIYGNLFVMAIDYNGTEIWNYTQETTTWDQGNCGTTTTDNGFLIVGTKKMITKNSDICVLNIDREGTEIWNKTYGGPASECVTSVSQTVDECYLLVGSTESYGKGKGDIWIIKIDNNGNEIWNRTIGTDENDFGMSIKQLPDGGFIITGCSDGDTCIIITDHSGRTQENNGNNDGIVSLFNSASVIIILIMIILYRKFVYQS